MLFGLVVGTWVVIEVIATYILLRVDPSTVLCSSSPGQSCSPPNQWATWLAFVVGVLGAAMVGLLLIMRCRRILGPLRLPPKQTDHHCLGPEGTSRFPT